MSTKTECVHRKTLDLAATLAGVAHMQASGALRNPAHAKFAKLPDALLCISVR